VFRGDDVSKVALAGLDCVASFTLVGNSILVRNYSIMLRKSGSKVRHATAQSSEEILGVLASTDLNIRKLDQVPKGFPEARISYSPVLLWLFLTSFSLLMWPQVPNVELNEMGPSFSLELRRDRLAAPDLWKSACFVPKQCVTHAPSFPFSISDIERYFHIGRRETFSHWTWRDT
jgi:hypothetical protein